MARSLLMRLSAMSMLSMTVAMEPAVAPASECAGG